MILSKHGAILAAEAMTRRDGEPVDYQHIDEEWDYEDYRSLIETDTVKLTRIVTGRYSVVSPATRPVTIIDEHRNVVGWM